MIERLWLQILQLKKQVTTFESPLTHCELLTNGEISINSTLEFKDNTSIIIHWKKTKIQAPLNSTVFLLHPNQLPLLLSNEKLPIEAINFLCLYLPYCFLGVSAKEKKEAQVVAHFAQTLDGKIATQSGVSKWIGNRENLIHAHRMRALCDGVLIGKGTLLIDDPELTVRHVKGDTPIRIIIGNNFKAFESKMNPDDGEILVCGKGYCTLPKGFTFHKMTDNTGSVCTTKILQKLYELGIQSIYLEGGPSTTSRFLMTNHVAILQLHLAPMVFGSGTSAIQLPPIDQLDESIQFTASKFFPIGDAIMFVGYL